MRSVLAGLTALLVAGVALAQSPVVNFPGGVKDLRSPNAAVRVFYVDLPAKPGEIPFYSLRLEYADHHAEKILEFERNADVSWAPDSNALYVSHNIGSNVADCYVVWPVPGHIKTINLTDVVTRRFPAPARFIKHADHGYVVCDGWNDSDHIRFTVYGDIFPRWYEFKFVYDLKRDVATLTSTTKKKLDEKGWPH